MRPELCTRVHSPADSQNWHAASRSCPWRAVISLPRKQCSPSQRPHLRGLAPLVSAWNFDACREVPQSACAQSRVGPHVGRHSARSITSLGHFHLHNDSEGLSEQLQAH